MLETEAHSGTNILVSLLGKQEAITIVIWMSQEFDEAYLGGEQIQNKCKNTGDSA